MILAHGGGWDEMLILVVPLGLVTIQLWLARRFGTEDPNSDDNATETEQ